MVFEMLISHRLSTKSFSQNQGDLRTYTMILVKYTASRWVFYTLLSRDWKNLARSNMIEFLFLSYEMEKFILMIVKE
jgi:hypothetical protein